MAHKAIIAVGILGNRLDSHSFEFRKILRYFIGRSPETGLAVVCHRFIVGDMIWITMSLTHRVEHEALVGKLSIRAVEVRADNSVYLNPTFQEKRENSGIA